MTVSAPPAAPPTLPPFGRYGWVLLGFTALGVAGAAFVVSQAPVRLHGLDWALLAAQPPIIQGHIAAAVTALVIGTVILTGPKGRTLHRRLGWTWVAAMAIVAVSSFFIRISHPGHFSWIHLLSGWTVIALPMGVAFARRRRIAHHRRTMTQMYLGALIVAGAFTFVPGRLMWRLFLG